MKKLMVGLFIGLFLLTLVMAEPPQEPINTNSLDVVAPRPTHIKQDHNVVIHTFVSNSTDTLGTGKADCYLNLYDIYGVKKFQSGKMDEDEDDYYVNISGGNFSISGRESFLIYCNSSAQAGFSSGDYEVTNAGVGLEISDVLVYLSLMILIITLFIIELYYGLTLRWENQVVPKDNYVYIDYKKYLKIVMLFGAYLTLTFLFAIAKGMANALIYFAGFYSFFDVVLNLALIGIMPTFILTFVFIVIGALSDKKIYEAVTRGLPVR